MRRAGFLTNAIMTTLIVVLSVTLIYTVFSYNKEQQQRTQSLRNDAERIKQEEEIAQKETEEETAKQEAIASLPIAISCRGESWAEDGANREDGWPAILGIIMEENDVNAEVSDYTWDMSGSLSQMRFADVPEETVNEYIKKHSESGLQNVRVETTVRSDLEENYIEREDFESIPVICIGYRGGYGRSSDELIEQQGIILNTYQLQEPGAVNTDPSDKENAEQKMSYDDGEMGISGKYLIAGRLPEGWKDLDNYENRMKEAWGDHYVSLNNIEGNVLSWEFREDVAETIYDKLEKMKYLKK